MEEQEPIIQFFVEPPLSFNFEAEAQFTEILKIVADREGFDIEGLNYIFCTDEYLHKINVEYLNHDTYTDIITFDNSEESNIIEGDIFVSIERVKENAKTETVDFLVELQRVIAHGLLHLCGYMDKTAEEKNTMREKEDWAISMFNN